MTPPIDLLDLNPNTLTDRQKLEWLKESGAATQELLLYFEEHFFFYSENADENSLVRKIFLDQLDEIIKIVQQRQALPFFRRTFGPKVDVVDVNPDEFSIDEKLKWLERTRGATKRLFAEINGHLDCNSLSNEEERAAGEARLNQVIELVRTQRVLAARKISMHIEESNSEESMGCLLIVIYAAYLALGLMTISLLAVNCLWIEDIKKNSLYQKSDKNK